MKKAFSLLLIFTLTLCSKPIYVVASGSPMNIADFALPEELGKIDSRFAGTSDRWVLLIQDIHGHFTAQENISAICDHLNQIYGIDTFGLEGGWSKTKLPRANALPNSRAKQQLARALLEEEYITGPFYSGLFSAKPLKLIGIENENLYAENRKFFLAHLDTREEAQKKIKAAEETLTALKQETYGPELLSFDRELVNFREGRNAGAFMPSLVSTAENLGVDLNDLDQIQLFKEILAAEKDLNREKLASEAKRLSASSPNSRLNFEELLRSGQIPPEKLSRYPQVLKFQEMMALQDSLSHHAFFDQIETTIARVKEKLFQSDVEKELDAKSERFGLIKKIVMLRAVPDDIKKASKEKDLLRAEASDADLSETLETGVNFYKLAQKRDSVFFQNIVKNPLLAGNIAVVAGGFHSEGLTARLEKENVSYMIITPGLGKEPEAPNEELYFARMRESAAETQTLSALANWPFQWLDRSYAAGTEELKKTGNQIKAVEAARNFRFRPAVAKGKKQTSVSVEDFMAMSEAEQKSTVEEWLKISEKPGTANVVLGYQPHVLEGILKTPEGLTFFNKYIVADKKMDLGEVRRPDSPYLLLSKQPKARIEVAEDEDLGQALTQRFQHGTEKPLMAIIDPDYKSGSILVLPPSAASLMLARPFAENRISGNVTMEFLGRVSSLMREFFEAQGVLETAA